MNMRSYGVPDFISVFHESGSQSVYERRNWRTRHDSFVDLL